MFVIRSICILELDIAVLVTPVKCYTRTRSVKRLKQHEMMQMSASLHAARVWTQNLFMKHSWHDVLHPMWLPSFCSTRMKKNKTAEPPAEFSLYSRSLSSSLVCPQTKCRHTSINSWISVEKTTGPQFYSCILALLPTEECQQHNFQVPRSYCQMDFFILAQAAPVWNRLSLTDWRKSREMHDALHVELEDPDTFFNQTLNANKFEKTTFK